MRSIRQKKAASHDIRRTDASKGKNSVNAAGKVPAAHRMKLPTKPQAAKSLRMQRNMMPQRGMKRYFLHRMLGLLPKKRHRRLSGRARAGN
jgi:hypothetical protein